LDPAEDRELREDATGLAVSQEKAVYAQHVHWAAGDLLERINTARWFERMRNRAV
jgi:hypothetical protein